MDISVSADFAPWQQQVFELAMTSYARDQLGHAQLLSGPPAMGKEEVAQTLAQSILCKQRTAQHQACGQCRSCQLFAAGTHPDYRFVTLEENENTGKLRTEIVIDQMRKLGEWMSKTSQLGGAQVVVIHPADQMNHSAANALLKTLEEPNNNRFIFLCADAMGRLPMTIRSRCQRLQFRLPSRDEAKAWLSAQSFSNAEIDKALDAADGHPGLAADWLRNGGMKLREQVRADLESVRTGKLSATAAAQQWASDEGEWRLYHAAEWLRQSLSATEGLRSEPPSLTIPPDLHKLSLWLHELNRLRNQWDAPVRNDLVLAGLLREWRMLHDNATPKAAGATR
jgi:DNA polymerase III subunit delta'